MGGSFHHDGDTNPVEVPDVKSGSQAITVSVSEDIVLAQLFLENLHKYMQAAPLLAFNETRKHLNNNGKAHLIGKLKTITDKYTKNMNHQPNPANNATKNEVRFLYRNMGSHYDVIFNEGPRFTITNIIGARYIDYLLHHPNEIIEALELEHQFSADKEQTRTKDSIQTAMDKTAINDTKNEIKIHEAELAVAKEGENMAKVRRLKGEIEALKKALKSKAGISGDSGERARNNVSKAINRVLKQLRKGNPYQKVFAQHLGQYISLGYEIRYSQGPNDVWE